MNTNTNSTQGKIEALERQLEELRTLAAKERAAKELIELCPESFADADPEYNERRKARRAEEIVRLADSPFYAMDVIESDTDGQTFEIGEVATFYPGRKGKSIIVMCPEWATSQMLFDFLIDAAQMVNKRGCLGYDMRIKAPTKQETREIEF